MAALSVMTCTLEASKLHCAESYSYLSWPREHKAISLGRDILAKSYSLPPGAEANLVDLSIAGKTAVRCMLPSGVCRIQAEYCSHMVSHRSVLGVSLTLLNGQDVV